MLKSNDIFGSKQFDSDIICISDCLLDRSTYVINILLLINVLFFVCMYATAYGIFELLSSH